jgi:hypothetical protein
LRKANIINNKREKVDPVMLGDSMLEVLIDTGDEFPIVPDRCTIDDIHLATEGVRGFDLLIPLM